MKRDKYYALLEDYRKQITWKEFNPYLCDRVSLEEIKWSVKKALKCSMNAVGADILDRYKHLRRMGGVIDADPQMRSLVKQKHRLDRLYKKIDSEEQVEPADYEDTYCEVSFLFGLTAPQFLVALLISAAVYLIYLYFARF